MTESTETTPTIAEATFHVRYAETDAMGIVHHSAYIVYFEEGRSEYIRQHGSSYALFERDGFNLAVIEVHAKYLQPARYDDKITVRTHVSQLRSRSLTFEYEIVHAESGEVLMTGSSKHICVDNDGQIRRIPDEWQTWT